MLTKTSSFLFFSEAIVQKQYELCRDASLGTLTLRPLKTCSGHAGGCIRHVRLTAQEAKTFASLVREVPELDVCACGHKRLRRLKDEEGRMFHIEE